MLNKFPTELEIYDSKVEPFVGENTQHFLISFDFEGPCWRTGW